MPIGNVGRCDAEKFASRTVKRTTVFRVQRSIIMPLVASSHSGAAYAPAFWFSPAAVVVVVILRQFQSYDFVVGVREPALLSQVRRCGKSRWHPPV